jgi:hypothetical protein
MLSALVLLLVAASALERPIKRLLRQSVLTWGIATLGALTMLLFLALALQRA